MALLTWLAIAKERPRGDAVRRAVLGRTAALALLAPFVASGVAGAVLIATENGRGNVVAPDEDPGWHHVGSRARNGMTVIYLGDGWILTANHVGAEDIRLGGVVYSAVMGSARRVINEDRTLTDLLLYRIEGNPSLPLAI